ncbi:MAG: hypothetical protein ACLVGW_00360 [Evtepia gabavorous]
MTCVCSGSDMIAARRHLRRDPLSHHRRRGCHRHGQRPPPWPIPAPGKTVGDTVEFGGLLGSAPVIPVHPFSSAPFIQRGGRIPAPMQSLKN